MKFFQDLIRRINIALCPAKYLFGQHRMVRVEAKLDFDYDKGCRTSRFVHHCTHCPR